MICDIVECDMIYDNYSMIWHITNIQNSPINFITYNIVLCDTLNDMIYDLV